MLRVLPVAVLVLFALAIIYGGHPLEVLAIGAGFALLFFLVQGLRQDVAELEKRVRVLVPETPEERRAEELADRIERLVRPERKSP